MNSHNALIPLTEGEIQGHNQPLCDARVLHTFLGVQWDFTTWIKRRISKYGFVEGEDYEVFHKIVENPQGGGGGRPTAEYRLTIGMAKELAMVENNERGRQARRWFIECERIAFDKRERIAVDTGPIGLCLPPGAEDRVVHASGLVENGSRIMPGTRRALLLGAEQDLLDIQRNRKAIPHFTGLVTLPSWIRLNRRHAMFGHVVEFCGGTVLSPWLFEDPFTADSIMFMREQYYSMDFGSLIKEQGYSTHCLIRNFR